jgi:putative transcriptional regulator
MKKKISVEDALIKSLKDARDYERGKKKLNSKSRELPAPAPEFKKNEIKHIRQDLDMTQVEFAQTLNVSVQTVRSWEQGGRKPENASNRLLQIIKQKPDVIKNLKTA